MKQTDFIWHNGKLKPWHEATVHVTTHALHYGSSVFEGQRVPVGTGRPGSIIKAIQKAFFGLFDGTTRDEWGWLTPVSADLKKAAA